MYDYVIVHASYGHPFEHWYKWLFDKLTSEGKKVLCPQFPAGYDEQNYHSWSKVLDAYKEYLDANTSYIGHSIGPAFIMDYLVNNKMKANTLFLVVPFYGIIDIPEYDHVNSTFMSFTTKWSQIPLLAKKTISFVSDNDPYVKSELSEQAISLINSQKIVVKNAGHFNTLAGYTSFELLLETIHNNQL